MHLLDAAPVALVAVIAAPFLYHGWRVARQALRRRRVVRDRQRDAELLAVWDAHREDAYLAALRLASARGELPAGLILMGENLRRMLSPILLGLEGA